MAEKLAAKTYARIPDIYALPNLIEVQLNSFNWFIEQGLRELFDEVSPIESFNGALKLYFPGDGPEARQFGLSFWFEDPKFNQKECLERDLTFARGLYIKVALVNSETNEHVVNDIFLGEFPWMTENGTFIYNGTERVVVSQLIRSPGVYFDADPDPSSGRVLASSKVIPDRGAWMEFETRKSDYITLKFNRKRTIPVTILLRAMAAIDDGSGSDLLKTGSDEEILRLFEHVDNNPDHQYILTTIRQEGNLSPRDKRSLAEEALLEFYRKMRPGDPPTMDNARSYLIEQLFDRRRYDLERVGRYKLNQRLGLSTPLRTITKADLVKLVEHMIKINNGLEQGDDIDHLGNRRVKTVGELIQNKLRIGLRRMERVVKERMSIREAGAMTPIALVNIRPVVAAIREFFGSSQLSQFMDQTNPLAELRHKRTLSALGPGGLRRERAGFDVRDVHHSHYGRICPIETPEGPNIGLIGRLASFARVNEYGFIETPYRRVRKSLAPSDERLVGRSLREDLKNPATKKVVAKNGERITLDLAEKIKKFDVKEVLVAPFVTDETEYLSADVEDRFVIAQANTPLNEYNEFIRTSISSRHYADFIFASADNIDYMDVAPHQIVGISAALIPFLEHDDANRALMGSNMQAQAVPLLNPDIPSVSTGMEYHAAMDSGQVVIAEEDGEVTSVTGNRIILHNPKGDHNYQLRKYQRSNQSTCIDQRPAVVKGQRIHKEDVIADSSSTENGELALGQNVVVAFLSWEGANFEDAIVISERLVQEDRFTSVHIEKYEVESRDTRLGPEEITRDIPNVGEDAIKDLDETGIIRIGAEVGPNDILVGKISPKGEKELTPEERLLRAIFGEKSRDVKDTSLRMPHGERGKVVDVKVFTREDNTDLAAGVDMMVRVSVAQRRKITAGDKMAGRHGNKGVVSRVVAEADMPFLEDGTPVDIILNPTGVPGRMNLGQVLETHLGWAASRLGFRAVTPVFDGATEEEIEAELARAWMIEQAWNEVAADAWAWLKEQEYDPHSIQDDDEVRRLYLESWLGKRKYDIYSLNDVDYARHAAAKEWLRDREYDPKQILGTLDNPDAEPSAELDQAAINVCLRLWMEGLG